MRKNSKDQKGFSYIDVMIAIVIMMVGILAMLSAVTANLIRQYESEKRTIAKQIALSTIESIIAAREINRPEVIEGWLSIRNRFDTPPVGQPNGIFLNGRNPIREQMGWDGVAGTIDDACADTGPCVVPGRPTNASPVVTGGYSREIVITDVDDPERPFPANPISRRRVDVTVRFFSNQAERAETASTIITNYEVSDIDD